MIYKGNDELLAEHFCLQKDINDIQSQIRKLEKTNKLLDQQNNKLRLELERKRINRGSTESSSNGFNRLLDRNYIVETLNRASEICEVATGEILKHAKYVTNNIIQNLNNANNLNTSTAKDLNKGLLAGVNDSNLVNTVTSGLSNTVDANPLTSANTNPIKTTSMTMKDIKNNTLYIDTFRQDTFRDSTSKESVFWMDGYIDLDNAPSILDSTIISNLSSNESIMLSDEEYVQVHHTGDYE